MSDTKAKKSNTEELLLVYLGVYVNSEHKLFYDYQQVTKDGEGYKRVGESMIYTKRLHFGMPGTIFSILWNKDVEGHQLFRDSAKSVGVWPNEDERIQWTALSRARENEREDSKALETLVSGNTALARLQPFREAYARASVKVKRQILAEIIRTITT